MAKLKSTSLCHPQIALVNSNSIKNNPLSGVNNKIKLARPTGFEPAIFSVTGRRDRPTSLQAQKVLKVSYQSSPTFATYVILLAQAALAQLARASLS